MFEARLPQGRILKRLVEAIKDLVAEANFDCNSGGITLQAMDSSHVSLVGVQLRGEAFERYRCDTNQRIGINFASLSKIMKCMGNDDVLTMRAQDDDDVISFAFEHPTNAGKVTTIGLKQMDIDSERLGVPDIEHQAVIKMPSAEFQRICADLSLLGDVLTISCTKEGIRFSTSGETGNGEIILKCTEPTLLDNKDAVSVQLNQMVNLSFAIRYLNLFAKATPLAPTVNIRLSADSPMMVEYVLGEIGSVQYFLAPKISEEE